MEPRVIKRDRKLHLTYELPHRIHSAQIYPISAPNGSTILLYGHEGGLRVLWRGGRRHRAQEVKQAPPRQRPNGANRRRDVIEISDDEDEQPSQSQQDLQAQWEQEEEELDPDCPYPNIIRDVDVDLGVDVLQVAIPVLPSQPSKRTDGMLRAHGVLAVACADGSQRVLTFALAPPAPAQERQYADALLNTQVIFPSNGSPCCALAAKIIAADTTDVNQDSQASDFLLVTAASDVLRIHRFSIFDELTALEQDASSQLVPLPHAAKHVSFNPSTKSTQIMISDISGAVRLYDPYASATSSARPSSSDSVPTAGLGNERLGKWITSFQTSFAFSKDRCAKRKKILDTKWLMAGKAIIVLLDDGEWGVWDLSASQPGQSFEDFALRGFLHASASDAAAPTQSKKGSRLVPMTPNTRNQKAEALFSGSPKLPGVASRGGLSISPSNSRIGQQDESILVWYNSDIYSIPSLQTFWQRSTNSSNTFGSLHSPGLTHITDIKLANELITSISQFAPSTSTNAFGQMNTQRDLLISAEHRLIISQTLRPTTPSRPLFQQALAEKSTSRDQHLLDAGELDIGGLDRMMDDMADRSPTRPRRVGFTH